LASISGTVHAYIGLGPLIPLVGSFLIYFFIVLIAVVGVLGYPLKLLANKLRNKQSHPPKNNNDDQDNHNSPSATVTDPPKLLSRTKSLVQTHIEDLETFSLKWRFSPPIHKPVFVCGLARSNTTLLTHILNSHSDTASFLYRDLPFPSVPYFWSFFNYAYYKGKEVEQRIHKDALYIDPNSPDAFEEVIWQKYIEQYSLLGFCRPIDDSFNNPDLEIKLLDTYRKVLFVRGRKRRYLAKGNYNLFRLKYILKLFPDAKIILCIRNPIDQCTSLARVHEEFMKLAESDSKLGRQLTRLGHFEFGPNRKAIDINSDGYDITMSHWNNGEDYMGYIQQWEDVYSFVSETYLSDSRIRNSIHIVDYSEFIANTKTVIKQTADFCELSTDDTFFQNAISKVQPNPEIINTNQCNDTELSALRVYESIIKCSS